MLGDLRNSMQFHVGFRGMFTNMSPDLHIRPVIPVILSLIPKKISPSWIALLGPLPSGGHCTGSPRPDVGPMTWRLPPRWFLGGGHVENVSGGHVENVSFVWDFISHIMAYTG